MVSVFNLINHKKGKKKGIMWVAVKKKASHSIFFFFLRKWETQWCERHKSCTKVLRERHKT